MNIEQIGSTIRRRRKSLGVDQRRLAQLSGVSVPTLSYTPRGSGNPTFEVLDDVLSVLGLEVVIQPKSPGTD